MMNIKEVLREMQEASNAAKVETDSLYALAMGADARRWAEVIEAAMREPSALVVKNQAGQIRLATTDGDAFDLYDNLGTKLFALPPDAAGEIERLKKIIRMEIRWHEMGDGVHRAVMLEDMLEGRREPPKC